MTNTIWARRLAGQLHARSRDDASCYVFDATLSPDWLIIPEETPGNIGGSVAVVERSLWFPLGVNPHYTEGSDLSPWTEQRTRWHLVRPETGWDREYPLAIAEIPDHGWYIMDLGPRRTGLMLEFPADRFTSDEE